MSVTPNLKVIYSKSGCEIVSKPYLIGDELSKLSLQSSKDFMSSLDLDKIENPVVLEILNGGRYYYMPQAVEEVTGKKPRVASLRAKEKFDETNNEWKVNIWDQEGDYSNGTIIIGDTVATGTTLAGTLNQLVESLISNNQPLYDIYVYAIAGSSAGLSKLQPVADKLATQGKSVTLVCGNVDFFT